MKYHELFYVFLAGCVILLSSGCVGPKNKRLTTEFYTLNYDAPEQKKDHPLPFLISMEPLDAVPPYDTTRMIYATSLFTVNSYAYHEWITYPAEMVTFLLSRDLRNAGIVQTVMINDSRLATHRISGRVESFCEQDIQEQWQACLSVSLTLIKLDEADITKMICLQKNYTATQSCPHNNPEGLAIAMSAAMSTLSSEIIDDIHAALLK
jgi:ABC-type uncharacterized transport system auxiliary subunit